MAQKKATIIKVSDDKVSIGMEDGSFFNVSRNELDFTPKVGDKVSVFSSGDLVIVTKVDVAEEKKCACNEIDNTAMASHVRQGCPQNYVVNDSQPSCEKSKVILTIISGFISVIIPVVIFLLVLRECDGSSYRADEKKEMKRGIQMNVSAGEILQEYKDNEIAADMKYRGKRVGITGCVERISRGGDAGAISFANTIYLNSCSWFSNETIEVNFRNEGQLTNAAQLHKGSKIMVQCTISNGGDGFVNAHYCTISSLAY